VDAAYFDNMRIPLLRGRAFGELDDEKAPRVVIVNETMARRFWPGANPIGKRLRVGFNNTNREERMWEVVGVARDGKYLVAFENPLPYFYVPLKQDFLSRRTLQVRSVAQPERLSAAVEREIHALDPEMPIIEVRTMRQALEGPSGFLALRFGALMAGAMGLLGLALAVVGVYGVVAFATAWRTREIGIRMALGATAPDVMGMVLRQGAWLVVAGMLGGLACTYAATRVMARFLFFVSATDPVTFTCVTLLLGATALAACYVPARRAMRVDPSVALRSE
jgi:putative ABC transport system permease protein